MLTQKLVLSYSTKIALQFIQMVASFIVARIVGPGVMGTIAYGLAYVSMFLFISDLGLGSAHIKLISEGQDEAKCIATFARLKIFTTSLYMLVVLSVYLSQKYLFHYQFESKSQEIVILIYLLITIISQILIIATTTWAGKTEQAKQDIPNFLQTLLYQILRVIVAILGYKAVAIVSSNLIAVIVTIPLYLFLFKNYKIGKYDKELAKKYFLISLPVIILIIAQTVIYSADKVILQSQTNTTELGYYSASYTLGSFIRTIEGSVGTLFFPLFSSLISQSNTEKLNKTLEKFERFSMSFILPCGLYLSIFSDLVISLSYGNKFMNSIPIFSIVVITMIISLLILPYGNIIFGKGLFKLTAIIWLVALSVFLICAYVFVSPSLLNLKGVGMAYSILITTILLSFLFIYFAKKHEKKLIILQGKFILIFGIVFSVLFSLLYTGFSFNLMGKFIMSVLYFAGFWGISYFTGIVKKEDWLMILELTNVSKMKGYINKEIFKK